MKKKTVKKKSVTIDDLAGMVAKGFAGVDEKFAGVDEKFAGIDKQFVEVRAELKATKKDINEVKENLKATRQDVLNIGDRFVPQSEFDRLLIRFDRVERKVLKK